MSAGPQQFSLIPGLTAAPGQLQPEAQPEVPAIDFSKFDLTKPGDQKKLLGHLQTMYGDQQKMQGSMAQQAQDEAMADPLGRMSQPVSGFIEHYDNMRGGSNSS